MYPGGHRLCEVQLAGRQPASGEGRLTCICKKLTQGRERTVGMAECPCPLGEGGSKGRHGCVGQECGPAGNKHSDQAGPETNRHLSRLGSREGAHKGGCLVTPPAPDLDGQDNQAAALRAEQLRVCPLFAAACKGKGGALNTTTPAAGLPRAGQRRYQRGVHGELLPAPQRQAVGNDLKPPVVDTIDLEIHVRRVLADDKASADLLLRAAERLANADVPADVLAGVLREDGGLAEAGRRGADLS